MGGRRRLRDMLAVSRELHAALAFGAKLEEGSGIPNYLH
jgi:hypothetical protein